MKKYFVGLMVLAIMFIGVASAHATDNKGRVQNAIPAIISGKVLPTRVETLDVKDPVNVPLHPDRVIKKVMEKTVILLLGDRPFCSGVIAQDTNHQTYVYTAAHCCELGWLNNGAEPKVTTYSGFVVNMKTKDIELGEQDDQCRVKIDSPHAKSTLKIAAWDGRYDLFVVSAFPRYSQSERTGRITVMGVTPDNPFHWVTSAQVFPGMSGSPVINTKGEIVGAAIAHYLDTPYPNLIISVMEGSGFLN